MNDSENFEQLRRLLALKRHEQPPPGYFNHFSREVIARIKAGEKDDTSGVMGWLARFWTAFETKPVFAGAFGAAVCALLVSGIFYSEKMEPLPVSTLANAAETVFPSQSFTAADLNRTRENGLRIASSTTPVMPQGNSFLDQLANGAKPQPVIFNIRN